MRLCRSWYRHWNAAGNRVCGRHGPISGWRLFPPVSCCFRAMRPVALHQAVDEIHGHNACGFCCLCRQLQRRRHGSRGSHSQHQRRARHENINRKTHVSAIPVRPYGPLALVLTDNAVAGAFASKRIEQFGGAVWGLGVVGDLEKSERGTQVADASTVDHSRDQNIPHATPIRIAAMHRRYQNIPDPPEFR